MEDIRLPLRGKVVLLVGGSRGLGRSIALGAARRGARITVTSRSKPDLEALRDQIEAEAGVPPLILTGDARDPEALGAAVEATVREFGHVDAGIYNAGVGYWEPIVEMPEERWDETFDINLKGAFLFARAILPTMLARQGGQLVYVSSRIAVEPIARYAAYAASKAGLRAFADVLSKEVGSRGIRVTTVLPGMINTGFSDVPHGRPRDQRPPDELILTAEEVAGQILHVLGTPDSAWVKELVIYPARL